MGIGWRFQRVSSVAGSPASSSVTGCPGSTATCDTTPSRSRSWPVMSRVFSANARKTTVDAITVVREPPRSFSIRPPSWSACTCVRNT